jgi:hypothetical protein
MCVGNPEKQFGVDIPTGSGFEWQSENDIHDQEIRIQPLKLFYISSRDAILSLATFGNV